MTERADIVIVGGGIFGHALAFELGRNRRRGRRIVVTEQRYSGYGASGRNIGRVRTSQFTPELAILARSAFAKHLRLADELDANALFWRPGYALVFYDEDEMAQIDSICTMLEGLGMPAEFHRGPAVVKRLPILTDGEPPVGCLIRPDAMVHHDALLYAYRRAAQRLGVVTHEPCTVTAIRRSGDEILGVETDRGAIDAPLVINATGGWSRETSTLAGVRVPNVPLRREVVVTDAWQPLMDTMITFYRPLEGWFHQTLRGEVVMGVVHPSEPQARDFSATDTHLFRVARHVLRKAPRLGHLRIVRQWAGVYDMTPDRKPMIGPMRALPGFVQANGDNGRGIALIPYLAELLAQWIDSGARPEPLEPFDANRYEGREDTPVVVGDYYAAYKKDPAPAATTS
jgi:sarcosine oxidase subunit beta